MQITIDQATLSKHLSVVSRAIPSKPNHPVLANVLLEADEENQQVRLTGFDLSLGIRFSFDAAVEVGGSLTLPAKLFGDIVSRLPEGEIMVESDEAIATIISSSGKYEIQGLSADEYPEMPFIGKGQGETVALLPDSLREGIKGTLFTVTTDETKQVLTGVHLTIRKDSLEFASTDGHRLSVVKVEREGSKKKELELTIPSKGLREIERAIAGFEEAIDVSFDKELLICEVEQITITTRILEGQFPNYPQLLPNTFSGNLVVDRKKFLGAVERIAVLADQKNNILKCSLDVDRQEISLSVDAKDVGSGKETLKATLSSEIEEIAFNVKYLLEGLKVMDATEVQLQFNQETMPVVISPLGGVKMTYLVMPVQLRK